MKDSIYPISKEAFYAAQGSAADVPAELQKSLCWLACDLINEAYFRGKRGEVKPDNIETSDTATKGVRDYIRALNAARAAAYTDGLEEQDNEAFIVCR